MKKPLTVTLYQTGYASSEEELISKVSYEKRKNPDKRKRLYVTNYTPSEYEELVFVDGRNFKDIFGEPDSQRKRNKHTIVKITNPETKLSVYRLFRTSSDIQNMQNAYAALTYTAIKKLTNSPEGLDSIKKVRLSEGAVVPFYWNHPNPATRISVRMGVWGIIATLICTIVSVCVF